MNAKQKHISPWAWVPTLYMAEGLPYVLVMVVSTIMYTRLGASLSDIGFWTSILGFAWVIKPLWGPLVDLYWTKRRWSILMQVLMGILLGVTGLSLLTDNLWWGGSLFALAIVALFSATHDIAADGFYMDALNEKQQAFFVGIRSTFYRISMIFGQGVLLIIAGVIEQRTGPQPSELMVSAAPVGITAPAPAAGSEGFVKFEPALVTVDAGSTAAISVSLAQLPEDERTVTIRRVPIAGGGPFIRFIEEKIPFALRPAKSVVKFFKELFPFGPEQDIALADKEYEVLKFGPDNWNVPQEIVLKIDGNLKEAVAVPFKAASGNLPLTWALCFGGVGVLLLGFGIYHLVGLPRPLDDGATVAPTTPFIKALGVMVLVVAVPVAVYCVLYYSINYLLSQGAHAIYGDELPFSKTLLTFVTIGIMVVLVWFLWQVDSIRRGAGYGFASAARVSHVPFDEVFASFFAKPMIGRMVAFLLLYRLGEALLVKMSGPFLIKPMAEGGMGLTSGQYGLAYGTVGIIAMTIGGILGGIVASRYGLKRWLLPMWAAINIPDLFYVYLAYAQPTEFPVVLGAVATETFGYGFGFTAYMLYMLYIAGTGEHKTSHFALCTGFMALGMMLPGMISGDIAESLISSELGPRLGWTWFFVIVCVATIPGFLMLALIPLDREFGRRSTNEPKIVEQD